MFSNFFNLVLTISLMCTTLLLGSSKNEKFLCSDNIYHPNESIENTRGSDKVFSDSQEIGKERIVLTGLINGISVSELYSDYRCSFDEQSSSYCVKLNLSKGDFFTFYMENRNTFINYPEGNEYGERQLSFARITKHYSIGRPHFCIYYPGTYEFILGSQVENLDDPSDIWAEGQYARVKFLGNEINSTYVIFPKEEFNSVTVYMSGDNPNILQYGELGIECNPLNTVTILYLDNLYLILKLPFDSKYSNYFKLTFSYENKTIVYEGYLDIDKTFSVDDKISPCFACCSLIDNIINQIGVRYYDNIACLNVEAVGRKTFELIKDKYKSLSDLDKKIFGKAFFCVKTNEGTEQVGGEDVLDMLEELIFSNNNRMFIIYGICLSTVIVSIVFLFLFNRKGRQLPKEVI